MKMRFNFPVALIAIGLILSHGPAFARTDVKAKQQQLSENLASSKANLDQYESNLKVVLSNIAETEKALKTLEKQRLAVGKQGAQSGKDQKAVDAAKLEINQLLKAEREKADAEDRQLEALRESMKRLEENRKTRAASIAIYEERLKKVETDQAGWGERNQSITDLEQGLKIKEEEARAEKKRLLLKKVEYEEEVAKWRKQVRLSERAVGNFSKVKEQ